jgi:hypothetical protein
LKALRCVEARAALRCVVALRFLLRCFLFSWWMVDE